MKPSARRGKKTDWLKLESELWDKGFTLVAGTDEVGRGPLAGPVVAAAVIFPKKVSLPNIDDSKRLTVEERNQLFSEIKAKALGIGVGIAAPEEIDKFNILIASLISMQRAIANLNPKPSFILVDGREKIPHLQIPQRSVIKGDGLSQSIAAAAIVAKVTRDEMMDKIHAEFPQFGFTENKGYGTAAHKKALLEFGPTRFHRFSFAPVSKADGKYQSLKLE